MFVMPLGLILGGGLIALGVLAIIGFSAFVGSQIDDSVEKPDAAIVPIKDDIPSFIRWPLLIGGVVLAVILAKKIGKKVIK